MGRELTLWWGAVLFAAGIGLGGVYFGGLWLTVRRASTAPAAHLTVALSFLARTAIVIAGLFWLTFGEWRQVLICLIGFLVARTALLRWLVPPSRREAVSGGPPR